MDSKQVVLITGSSTGFGRLFAETLARNGHTVFATMRDPGGRNATNASEIRALAKGESLLLNVLELDVTNDVSVERAVNICVAQAGRIDIAINNAANALIGLAEAVTTRTSPTDYGHEFLRLCSRQPRRTPSHATPAKRLAFAHQQRRGTGNLPGLWPLLCDQIRIRSAC